VDKKRHKQPEGINVDTEIAYRIEIKNRAGILVETVTVYRQDLNTSMFDVLNTVRQDILDDFNA
jgi:hypothetical protein